MLWLHNFPDESNVKVREGEGKEYSKSMGWRERRTRMGKREGKERGDFKLLLEKKGKRRKLRK